MTGRRQDRLDRIARLREGLRSKGSTWGVAPNSIADVEGKGLRVERMEGGSVMVGGVTTKVLSVKEASKSDILVCMEWEGPHFFPDDVRGTCAMCERAVRFRPDAPKKPARVCRDCVEDAQGVAIRPRSIFG